LAEEVEKAQEEQKKEPKNLRFLALLGRRRKKRTLGRGAKQKSSTLLRILCTRSLG